MFLRPRVAILGRFSKKASAIRFGAVLSARELVELVELVWTAGGEPITYLPVPDRDWSFGLQGVDAVLLPGGGDIDPACYGGEVHSEVYDVDVLQDQSDFDLTEAALATGIPVWVCAGVCIFSMCLKVAPWLNTCRIHIDIWSKT